MKKAVLLSLFFIPIVASAQSIQLFFVGITRLASDFIAPVLLSIAFLFFLINAVRYFIIDSTNEEGRKKAKALGIYGIIAFVLMFVFIGLVNFVIDGLGFDGVSSPPQSDFVTGG